MTWCGDVTDVVCGDVLCGDVVCGDVTDVLCGDVCVKGREGEAAAEGRTGTGQGTNGDSSQSEGRNKMSCLQPQLGRVLGQIDSNKLAAQVFLCDRAFSVHVQATLF